MAALSAAVGVGVVLAAAFVVAMVMPENSFVDLSNDGVAGFWQGVLNQACGMTLAMFAVGSGSLFFPVSSSFRIGPLLFVAFPLGGCALGAYLVASRGIRLPARLRFRCGIATAVPFALGGCIAFERRRAEPASAGWA